MLDACCDYEYCLTTVDGDPIRTPDGSILWMGAQRALEVARDLVRREPLGPIHRRWLGHTVRLVDLVAGVEGTGAAI